MSMICWVLGVASAQINALRAKPALVSKLTLVARIDLLGAHLDDLTRRMTLEQRAQLEASQAQFAANPAVKKAEAKAEATVADARAAVGPLGPIEKALSLEKSWHMLHYLFTGHVGTWHSGELLSSEVEAGEVYEIFAPDRLYDERHEPGNLLLSGEELGENVGYGPARLHDQSKTSDFSRFLAGQDLARLRAHTDFDAMNRAGVLYGARESGDEALHQMLHEEIALYFQLLRDYVRAMADKGNGLMVWIS
jgi:Domain of unknown function (DUF1877)